MKNPKGFRGKYFSLAAILALNATLSLASDVQSVVDTEKQLYTPKAEASSETTEVLEESSAPVVVISKKIKEKKSEVYTASKSLVSATNVTDNVSIITSEELSLKGITSVIDALNTIPGVSFASNGGLGKSTAVMMQGMSNQYTLVMVDGVRYNDPSALLGDADLSHLLVGDIERIEVIKGAQSGVWGADAAAGVINIITKNPQVGIHGTAGVEFGSYGRRSANTSISHKTDKFDVMLSVQRVTEDGFTAYAPRGENIDQYEDDGYRNTTVNLKAGYWIDAYNRIEAGYHDINSLSSYDDFGFPNSSQHSDAHIQSGYLTYKYFTSNHAIETTLSQSSFHRKELNASYTGDLNDYQGKVPSLELKDTWKYYDNSALVFGTSYEKRELTYTAIGDSEKEHNEHSKALYMNNTNKVGNVILTEALRYDSFSAFDDKVTGKIGAKYLFSDQFNIYTNYGTAYKSPSMFEMIYPWASYGMSNFDLKPENIKSFNIGLQYAGFNMNIFRNEIEDMIDAQYDASTYKYQYVNLNGTSVMKGIELSYEQQLLQSLLIGANYTYVDAKGEDGERLKKRPRYQSSLYATYMPTNKLTFNVNGTYIGSRADVSFDPITYAQKDEETGNYFVASAKASYQIDKTWNVYLKANNLFDRYYQTVYGYASAGRSVYAGAEARF
ncbi:TonB-dependent receptor plug domain-containing protein [Sulfurospirillum diekertiae]|uniref:Outer membrane receptor n=1 Tax=Sulfurospirillum diekertiae TaxID=1854492 RepID=A0A1Y0HPF0_9BACT|nr:TonB-dependent receptor [Sulfurospirillum diekertiae]ARU49083.1 outer membrane receptor [Sulfurospirillum diekertiae]ASC93896.1 outer membrane receptor [Sulfurospirillum diekertiae]